MATPIPNQFLRLQIADRATDCVFVVDRVTFSDYGSLRHRYNHLRRLCQIPLISALLEITASVASFHYTTAGYDHRRLAEDVITHQSIDTNVDQSD